jgi:hypothetical protein
MVYETKFLISLALSVVTETIILVLLMHFVFGQKKSAASLASMIFAGFAATCATLPYVWFVFPAFVSGFILYVILAELFAVAAESVFYHFILKLPMPRAFVLSLVCNAVSFGIGEGLKALNLM